MTLHKDGSASVDDNGRGIPTDIHPKEKVSGVQLVFTKLHAGGKFGQGNYAYSGGLHGVGASVTNALSEWLRVMVYQKHVYKMSFRSYYNKRKGKYESGVPDGPLEDTGEKTKRTGTYVHFKPDANVFSETDFDLETVEERLNELAFLNNKGLEIILVDERISMADAKRRESNLGAEETEAEEEGERQEEELHNPEPQDLFGEVDMAALEKMPYTVVYKYNGGISDFVKNLNEGKRTLYPVPIYYQAVKNNVAVEFAIQHTTDFTESLFSFVNNIPTPEGGYHETGFRSGLVKVLNDYARSNGFLKDKDPNFQGDDFREGLTAVLSVKMQNVQFEGQTKTKLGNTEARPAVEAAVIEGLNSMMSARGYKKTFDEIIKKAQGAAKVRLAAKQAKENARAKNSIDGLTLVGKLAACSGRKPELNEMFIVEGDSAGGTAKQARVRQFQSILPLRGSTSRRRGWIRFSPTKKYARSSARSARGWIPISSWTKSIITRSSSSRMPTRTACTSAAFCSLSFSATCARSSTPGTCTSACPRCTRCTRGTRWNTPTTTTSSPRRSPRSARGISCSGIRVWAR